MTQVKLSAFVVAVLLFGVSTASAAPVYQVNGTDKTWQSNGDGTYSSPTSDEDTSVENWERPVKFASFTTSPGGLRTTTDLYYAYADLVSGAWGVDSQFLYLRFEVVGQFEDKSGGFSGGQGFKAQYYFYFEPAGQDGVILNLSGGTPDNFPVGSNYGATSDLMYTLEGSPVPSAGNGYDGTNGTVTGSGARRNGNTFEVRAPLSAIGSGLTESSFTNLDYAIMGAAVSDPSAPGNIWARDNPGGNIEYDTIVLGTSSIPEPSAFLCLGFVAIVPCLRHWLRSKRG